MGRNFRVSLVVVAALIAIVWIVAGYLRGQNRYPEPDAQAAAAPYKNTFFDQNPSHPWNQLYGLLFIRPAWNGKLYGEDEMDPLYWQDTRYLLEGPLHQKTLDFLDRFIEADSAQLIKEPLKRALLQRMLWALFDRWAFYSAMDGPHRLNTYDKERRELQARLVKIMRSVALTDDEIDALPDNYNREIAAKTYPAAFDPAEPDKPFLPATFFSGTDWVDLGTARYEVLAPVHVRAVAGRAEFHVLMSLPGGRDETLGYLKKLHDFQPHWTYDPNKQHTFMDRSATDTPSTNPDIPQVPPLTKFALVRKADLIDNKGEIHHSPLMETVQIRVIRTIQPNHSSGGEQTFLMFELDPKKLMKGEGGLVAQTKEVMDFDMVLGAGPRDPLQSRDGRNRDVEYIGQYSRVNSCFGCHSAPGIASMNSYVQFFQDRRTLIPPELEEGSSSSISWKREQYSWGLLQAYWFAN